MKLPDIGLNPHPDRDAAQDAVWGHFRSTISSTVPTTARGCAELARYVGEFREFQGLDLADELLLILNNIASAPLREGADALKGETAPQPAETRDDPVIVAMRASWQTKAAWDRFEERIKGASLTPARQAEERRLIDEDSRARDVVYATTPTTRHGQIALLQWLREQINDAGCVDGEPADGHESVWADGYRALAASLLSPPVEPGSWSRVQADGIDLSGCGVRGFAHLSELFNAAADTWSNLSCLPYVQEDEVIARVVDGEYERAGFVRDRLIGLIRNCRPKNDSERDDALSARLRHELNCEMKVRDQALLAEINAAWGG